MYRYLTVVVFLCVVYFVAVLGKQEIYTKDEVKYIFFSYSNASIIHFKVKTANDAHVGLTTGPAESDPMIEVVIGGWANTNSVIRRRFRTIPEKVTMETPGILSAGEFRGFWVRWDGGVISVGREDTSIPFMSWADPSPFRVSYAGVHTGFGASGSWIIEDPPAPPTAAPPASNTYNEIAHNLLCSSGSEANTKLSCQVIQTEDDVKYKFYPYSGSMVNFKVKAVNDVHIGLSRGPRMYEPMIEIVIGGWGNTKSVIRRLFRNVPEKVTVETPGILNADEFRGFWVSWDGGVIEVGREGADVPFMAWSDPYPFPVAYIGIHTGFGSIGTWKIEDPLPQPVAVAPPSSASDSQCCKCCYKKPPMNFKDVLTQDTSDYKFFPYSNTSVNFKVKAVNDVHVGLSTGPSLADPMIEVVIGGWGNTKSVLRRLFKNVPEKVSVETPGILSENELRGFWVRWYGGVILVGREGTDTPFMSWQDPDPFYVTHIGVHTGFGSTGTWQIEDPSSAPAGASLSSTASDVVVDSLCCKCCNRGPLPLGDTTTPAAFTNAFVPRERRELNQRLTTPATTRSMT